MKKVNEMTYNELVALREHCKTVQIGTEAIENCRYKSAGCCFGYSTPEIWTNDYIREICHESWDEEE